MPSPAAPYTPYYPGGWADGSGGGTPIEQAPLNHMEAGIEAALPAPTGPNSGDLPIWNPAANGGAGGWDTTTNMKIAKAALTSLDIVDADIDAAAAIALSKLNGFPNSPSLFARGDGVWAFPASEVGYDSSGSTTSVTGTTSGAATTIITGSAHTFDGGVVMAEFFAPIALLPSVAGGSLDIGLFEGATFICTLAEFINPAAAAFRTAVSGKIKFSPSAGSHTYSVKAWVSSTTGAPFVSGGAGTGGAQAPVFLRFTKAN